MVTIEVEDKEKWGQKRLFAKTTWPGKNKNERMLLASQVVDAFHRKMRDIEVNIQWIPRLPCLMFRSEENEEPPDHKTLEGFLEEAYAEVAATKGSSP